MKTIEIKGTTLTKLIFENDAEWLAFRKDHIGASDCSIIMGTSKWKTNNGMIKTPKLLFQEKLGLDTMNCDNAATRYGKAMEEPARQVYQEMVSDLFEPMCIKNSKYPYAMVSLDGLNITDDRAVEIKNCSLADHEIARQGKVPDKYYSQVQMQIMVTEFSEIDYFSFHDNEGIIVKVKRDDEYILELDNKLKAFWNCVTNFIEPELTEDDYIEQDQEWFKKAKQLYNVQQTLKPLVAEEKVLKDELKLLSNDRNSKFGDLLYTRSIYAGRVDYKSIPEIENIDLTKYTGKPTVSWRLKKAKN